MANNGDEIARLRVELSASTALRNGMYYSPLREVFVSSCSMAHTNPLVFTSLKRDRARSAPTAQQLGPAYYTVTQHWFLEQTRVPSGC
jgi:hypothetical protein